MTIYHDPQDSQINSKALENRQRIDPLGDRPSSAFLLAKPTSAT